MRNRWRAVDPDTKKAVIGIAVCVLFIFVVALYSALRQPAETLPPQLSEKRFLYKLPITYEDNTQGCWEAGDSLYDYDSQAKLIALTNIYFTYADNPGVLEQIAHMAVDIRNTAGTTENDCLTEADDIAELGKALDKAVTEKTLSYEVLRKLQRAYAAISNQDTADAETSVYAFGKVDITVRLEKKEALDGGTTGLDCEVVLTSTAHYTAYVIYLPEFDYSLSDTVSALAAYGCSNAEICAVEAFSEEKFAGIWNAIGPTPSGANVPYVFLLMHAEPDELYGKQFRFSNNAMRELCEVPIDTLILFGCSAGHFGYLESNPASALSEKISGGLVLASDSTVYYEPNDDGVLTYMPITDDTFSYFIETKGRESMGWLVYQYSGGKVNVFQAGTGRLTVTDMLESITPERLTQNFKQIF